MTRTLPYDVGRCAGRYDFEPDGEWCPHRDSCQRYLAFVKLDKAAGVPDYKGIPVSMGVPDCDHKIDVIRL